MQMLRTFSFCFSSSFFPSFLFFLFLWGGGGGDDGGGGETRSLDVVLAVPELTM